MTILEIMYASDTAALTQFNGLGLLNVVILIKSVIWEIILLGQVVLLIDYFMIAQLLIKVLSDTVSTLMI